MPQNAKLENISTFSTNKSDSEALITSISEALLEKKAEDIKVLDVRELTTLTEFFVVCHGTSETQIKALTRGVSDKVKETLGENEWKKEGYEARRWVILDYVNVVVHIFNPETREYYGLEKMWNDAVVTEISDKK